MARSKTDHQPMPSIWENPDAAWSMLQTMLNEHYPANPKGHRRVDLRRVLNGLLLRLRNGSQWNQLPQQFGDDSTVHRHFQHWCQQGLFERFRAVLVQRCAALNSVDRRWQAADTMMVKALMGGDLVGRHPTDRGNKG